MPNGTGAWSTGSQSAGPGQAPAGQFPSGAASSTPPGMTEVQAWDFVQGWRATQTSAPSNLDTAPHAAATSGSTTTSTVAGHGGRQVLVDGYTIKPRQTIIIPIMTNAWTAAHAYAAALRDQGKVIEDMKTTLEEADSNTYAQFLENFHAKADKWAEHQKKEVGTSNVAYIALRGALRSLGRARDLDQGRPKSKARQRSLEEVADAAKQMGVMKDVLVVGTLLDLAKDSLLPIPNVVGIGKLAVTAAKGMSRSKKLKTALGGVEKMLEGVEGLADEKAKLEAIGKAADEMEALEKEAVEGWQNEK